MRVRLPACFQALLNRIDVRRLKIGIDADSSKRNCLKAFDSCLKIWLRFCFDFFAVITWARLTELNNLDSLFSSRSIVIEWARLAALNSLPGLSEGIKVRR